MQHFDVVALQCHSKPLHLLNSTTQTCLSCILAVMMGREVPQGYRSRGKLVNLFEKLCSYGPTRRKTTYYNYYSF